MNLYKIQRDLQKKIDPHVYNAITSKDVKVKETVSIQQVMYMIDECCEVLRELNYKYWRSKKKVNKEKLKEELIDVRKFLMNIELIWGFTEDEIEDAFIDKTEVNIGRHEKLNA